MRGLARIGTIAAAAMFACVGAAAELTVWIGADLDPVGFRHAAREFSRSTAIDVVVAQPDDAPGRFQLATAAGGGPDIWCWRHERIGEWARSGAIAPVAPAPALRAGLDPLAWQAFRFRGQTWGYPLALETIALVFNQALVREAPRDFEALAQLDARLRPGGRRAIAWELLDPYLTWPLLAAGDGSDAHAFIFGRDRHGEVDPAAIGVDRPEAVAQAEALARLLHAGAIGTGAREFVAGTAALTLGGPAEWQAFERRGIAFGLAPLPLLAGRTPRPFVAVHGCMIAATSRQPGAARRFIETALLRPGPLRLLAAAAPLRVAAHLGVRRERSRDPRLRALLHNLRAGALLPNEPQLGAVWAPLATALEEIASGQSTPQQALEAAARRIAGR